MRLQQLIAVQRMAIFNAGNAVLYLSQYLQLSQDGALSVDVTLVDDIGPRCRFDVQTIV